MADQFQLFPSSESSHENLLPRDGTVFYYGPVFSPGQSNRYFDHLLQTIPWEHDEVFLFGKKIITARQVAWFGNTDKTYTYSGKTHHPVPWNKELSTIKATIENLTNTAFNSCLANLYREGEQGMGWHQDNEKELGPNPIIASISFGAERRFDFRHKQSREKIQLNLEHGSLLLMSGTTQANWQHQLPKTKKITLPRINLTFRTITS